MAIARRRIGFRFRLVAVVVALVASRGGYSAATNYLFPPAETLPSPYHNVDSVQYFPAGPEFKLIKEAIEPAAASETVSNLTESPNSAE